MVSVSGGTAPYVINGVQQTGVGPFTISVTPSATTTYNNANVTVTDSKSCGSSISGSAVITVNPLPTATINSNNSPICSGSDATFTLSGTPDAQVTYSFDGGATGNQVTLDGIGAGTVTATNATSDVTLTLVSVLNTTTNCGQNVGGTSTVTVNTLPVITCPSDIVMNTDAGVCIASVNAAVTVTGSPAPMVTYTIPNGAHPPMVITFPHNFIAGTTTLVTATATNSCGTVSCTFNVTVNDPVTISGNPADQTITYGSGASFSVAATSNGIGLNYQWQVSTNGGGSYTNVFNGGIYSGATSPTLSLSLPTVSMSGYEYRCVVQSQCVGSSTATSTAGVLTVGQRAITITASNQGKIYGDTYTFANDGSDVSVTTGSLQNGDAITANNAASAGAAAAAVAGPYTITLGSATIKNGATDVTSNYNIMYATGTLTVGQRAIMITANDEGKIYGDIYTFANDGSDVSVTTGLLQNGDAITANDAASAGAAATALVGPYTITLGSATIMSGATDVTSSYAITYATGTLTVGQRAITITASNQGKTYGDTYTFANDGSDVSVTTGLLQNGDAITTDNAASAGAAAAAVAGPYTITLGSATIMNGATDVTPNYDIMYATGTLTVGQRAITITANDQDKTYGDTYTFANDGSDVSVTTGLLQNGDAITANDAASAGAAAAAVAGPYTITLGSVTIQDGSNNDVTSSYAVTYITGTLTVGQRAITITANDQGKIYGDIYTFANDGSDVSVTTGSLQNSDAITSDDASSTGSAATALVGPYPITLGSATIQDGSNNDVTSSYDISYATGTLTVGQRAITITANDQGKIYGDIYTFANDGSDVSVTAGILQNGDAITTDDAASTRSRRHSGSGALPGNIRFSNHNERCNRCDIQLRYYVCHRNADSGTKSDNDHSQ